MSEDTPYQPYIIFLTGCPGAGKTELIKGISKEFLTNSIACLHFDDFGILSKQQIQAQRALQKEKITVNSAWVERILKEYQDRAMILVEAELDLSFIIEGFKNQNYNNYKIILLQCDKETRNKRLIELSKQSHLANEEIEIWSKQLLKQAQEMNVPILNTTALNVEQMVNWLKSYLLYTL